jgi:hypothetical protein
MVEHPISFEGNEIQAQHICDPELIISCDDTMLEDEGAI